MAKLMDWIDDRFPATKVWQEHMAQYYAPKNFNFWILLSQLGDLAGIGDEEINISGLERVYPCFFTSH